MSGLYIHIPFCVRKCLYCDFCSRGLNDDKLLEDVVCALINELDLFKNNYRLSGEAPDTNVISEASMDNKNAKDNKISSIFIGGGTPSVVPAALMERLLIAIDKAVGEINGRDFDGDLEYTVECNPGTADLEKLRLYRDLGINRLSIGAQSLNDNELKKLGRIHSADVFYKTYELARRAGFENINTDIMSAIPGQTIESYERTVDGIISLKPEHISAYSLIIEEGTPFYDMYHDSPPVDEETDLLMYELTYSMLEAAGYTHYEVSNYARLRQNIPEPDKSMGEKTLSPDSRTKETIVKQFPLEKSCCICKHNLNYWRRGSYTGIGPSAASFDASKGRYGTRYKNISGIESYVKAMKNPDAEALDNIREETETLTKEQALMEDIFLGLRTGYGISINALKEKYGALVPDISDAIMDEYVKNGYVKTDDDRICLTDSGFFISDRIVDHILSKL